MPQDEPGEPLGSVAITAGSQPIADGEHHLPVRSVRDEAQVRQNGVGLRVQDSLCVE